MNKYYLFGLLFVMSITVFSQQNQGNDVTATIESFFTAFHEKDTVKLSAMLHEHASLKTVMVASNGSTVVQEITGATFLKSIASMNPELVFEEKLLAIEVKSDSLMAIAWTPYEFYVDGKLSHTGTNVFTMYREADNRWVIFALADTRKKP